MKPPRSKLRGISMNRTLSGREARVELAMEIRLTIPDKVASVLQQQWPEKDIPRHIMEDLVLKWYQEELLTAEEVRVTLGLDTTLQVDALLKQHGIPSKYTAEDFAADLATHDQLGL
jgi:hypothetical protein